MPRAWMLLPLLTLAVLAALLFTPQTRDLMAAQGQALFSPPTATFWTLRELGIKEGIPEGNPEGEQRMLNAVAERYLDDPEIQTASVLMRPFGSDQRVDELRALARRFPKSAALHAHSLRFSALGQIRLRRDAEVEKYMTGTSTLPPDQQTATAEQLAAYDRDAAEGESLDPDNAFFPFMRAIGLFATKRDKEGVAALLRASRKSRWDDYVSDEARADWRLLEAAFGRQSALQRCIIHLSLLFPHYAQLRSAARFSAYKATQAEVAGKREEGLTIRRAVMRLGSLMRVKSPSLIGSFVGVAIVPIQMNRPGGAPPLGPPSPTSSSSEDRQQQRLNDYTAYLKRIGHADEAIWVENEIEAGKQVRALLDPKGAGFFTIPNIASLHRLIGLWTLSLLILMNGLVLLALGATAWLLARFKRIEGATPALALLGVFVLMGLFAWQQRWGEGLAATRYGLDSMAAMQANKPAWANSSLSDLLRNPGVVQAAVVTFSLLLPLLILIILGIRGVLRREPSSPVLVRGLQQVGIPIACLLLLLYSGLTFATARLETESHTEQDRMLQQEGRYYAERLHKSWPP